jgi:hypothetical protein
MLTTRQIKAQVKRLLPMAMRERLRIQTGVHGCYRGTVQVWLEGWPCKPCVIPDNSYQTYCETAEWGSGPYNVSPRDIADHIIAQETQRSVEVS